VTGPCENGAVYGGILVLNSCIETQYLIVSTHSLGESDAESLLEKDLGPWSC
jgi:hypothetical protein